MDLLDLVQCLPLFVPRNLLLIDLPGGAHRANFAEQTDNYFGSRLLARWWGRRCYAFIV